MHASDTLIVWSGLPAYAARLVAAAPGDFPIVATRPLVPIEGMDEILPGRIRWIDESFRGGFAELGLSPPRLLIRPSWHTRYADRLEREVAAEGGHTVVAFDNVWTGEARQMLGAARFRTQWAGRFAAAWVVGEGGRRLARLFGFASQDIYDGFYGTEPTLFADLARVPLDARPKRIVFTGRLVEQKGLRELLAAWRCFHSDNQDWSLHLFGTGPLEKVVRAEPVVYHGFKQPAELAAALAEARFLVLPSHDEHWGLVVCEAAQAGCGLLLSEAVGSYPDLLGPNNGRLFRPHDAQDLTRALVWAAERGAAELQKIEHASRSLGLRFTPARWAGQFSALRGRFAVESRELV